MAQSVSDTRADSRPDSLLSRIVGWLTAGYPEGIPATDRFAVVALLKRRLTDEQIHEIVDELTSKAADRGDSVSDAEIEELTRRVLSEQPSTSDLSRVSARLAAAGWPLEGTV